MSSQEAHGSTSALGSVSPLRYDTRNIASHRGSTGRLLHKKMFALGEEVNISAIVMLLVDERAWSVA